MDSPFLVVPVYRLIVLEVVWTLGLTDDALSKELLLLIYVVVEEWALQILALLAPEVHLLELWENSCSLGDDSSNLDERIQMHLPQVSEFVLDWEILDSYKNLIMDLVVIWINLNDNINGDLVDDLEHQLWLLGQPNSESWVFGTQVVEDDLEALLVVLAHFMNLLLIEIGSLLGLEMSDEVLELPFDISDDLLLLQPDEERASNVLQVQDCVVVL